MSNAVSNPIALDHQYDALVSKLKQMRRDADPLWAPAIAIVSCESGAGVTTVAKALTDRLNASSKAKRMADVTISLSPDEVACTTGSMTEFIARLFEQHVSVLEFVFSSTDSESESTVRDQAGVSISFEQCLATARSLFRFILVECLPLNVNSDIATVAPLVDGVLIVIEANKTTRSQAERLASAIHTAGGTVLGYVLNKQTFPIPSSIYQLCEKAGII